MGRLNKKLDVMIKMMLSGMTTPVQRQGTTLYRGDSGPKAWFDHMGSSLLNRDHGGPSPSSSGLTAAAGGGGGSHLTPRGSSVHPFHAVSHNHGQYGRHRHLDHSHTHGASRQPSSLYQSAHSRSIHHARTMPIPPHPSSGMTGRRYPHIIPHSV